VADAPKPYHHLWDAQLVRARTAGNGMNRHHGDGMPPIPVPRRPERPPATPESSTTGYRSLTCPTGSVDASSRLSSGAADAGVEATAFKQAMRHLAAAVVMVTTRVDGRPCGLTISFDDPQRLWPWIEDQAEARRFAAATAGRLWRALSTRAHARSALGLASRRLVKQR
jgi:hypothetical protein